jgi:hypothetical protein
MAHGDDEREEQQNLRRRLGDQREGEVCRLHRARGEAKLLAQRLQQVFHDAHGDALPFQNDHSEEFTTQSQHESLNEMNELDTG